jgi:hypothetical protein
MTSTLTNEEHAKLVSNEEKTSSDESNAQVNADSKELVQDAAKSGTSEAASDSNSVATAAKTAPNQQKVVKKTKQRPAEHNDLRQMDVIIENLLEKLEISVLNTVLISNLDVSGSDDERARVGNG